VCVGGGGALLQVLSLLSIEIFREQVHLRWVSRLGVGLCHKSQYQS